MNLFAAISGYGCYSPERVLDNHELESMVDTNDEWIVTRTGISKRHIAAPDETTSSLCTNAAKKALDSAGLAPEDIDLIICATTTPDHLLPATGCLVQRKIEATNAAVIDMNSACSGFVAALITATQFIRCGTYKRVLVVAGETLSRMTNWNDRTTCVLFGDGSGAVVLEATDKRCGVLGSAMACKGDIEHMLAIEAGGSARPASAETVAAGEHFITMRGNDVFKHAVRAMASISEVALTDAGISSSDLRMVIPHQANERILKATGSAMDVPEAHMFYNIAHCGNTGSASIPIALCEFLDSEKVDPGENLLLVAFGGGLSWGAVVIQWADIEQLKTVRSL